MISLTPDVRLCLVCETYLSTSELLIYSVAALTVTSTKLKEKREREKKVTVHVISSLTSVSLRH